MLPLLLDAAGAMLPLLDEVVVVVELAALSAGLAASVELELLDVEALGAGAVGAGDALAAGVEAGGVTAVVVDFCSVQAEVARATKASAMTYLFIVVIPSI